MDQRNQLVRIEDSEVEAQKSSTGPYEMGRMHQEYVGQKQLHSTIQY